MNPRPEPPGLVRVVLLLAGVSVRRWWNRIASRRRKRKPAAGRTATGRKGGRSTLVLVVFGCLMMFNSVGVCTRFVGGMATEIEERYENDGNERLERSLSLAGRVFPGTDLWLEGRGGRDMAAGAGLVLAGLMLALFFMGLGGGNVELGQVGWSMEWLFTFPVATRSLFFARVGEYTLTNIFGWLTAFPLLLAVLVSCGYGGWGILLALGCTVYVNALVGAARLVVETAARKRLSLHGLKNIQAASTVLGLVALFGIFALTMSPQRIGPFVDLAMLTPTVLLAQPLSAPLLLCHGGVGALAVVGFFAVLLYAALRLAGGMVRDGLITVSGGPYRGARKVVTPAPDHRRRGLLGKEFLLLRRDRNFLVQTLVVPLLLLTFWGLTSSGAGSWLRGARTGATVAFVVGAYVLMYGAFSILATESKALWLLFSFPQPLDRLLRRKALLWAAIAGIYTVIVLCLAWRPGADPGLASLLGPLMALAGIYLFAFVAGGLGVLGTDPLEQEPRRRIRPEWVYLYFALIAIYAHGVYSDSVWAKLAVLTLVSLLTYSIWDSVRVRLPLLLDPTQRPAPRLAPTDGIVAALIFFELQALAMLILSGSSWPAGARVVIAYFWAGVLTVLASLYLLRRLGARRAATAVGLRGARTPAGRALLVGALFGAGAGLFGLAYMGVIEQIEPLRDLEQRTHELAASGDAGMRWAMAGIAVLLAPLFEEFLFRGLVFRALRRSAGLWWAILLSAAVFGIVHPPLSFVPVFVLGVAAAYAFERTGLLWTPIAAHVAYNAIVVVAWF